jgi:hypothetical protein
MTIDSKLIESRILLDSIAGLEDLLGKIAANYGKPPIKVVSVASSWTQREIQQTFGAVTYPYIGLSLQRFATNTESYNYNLRRSGIAINSPKSNTQTIYRLIPIITNFRVRYYTQDLSDLLAFSSRWQLRQKDSRFTLSSSDFHIKIKVKFNNDLSIPDQENTDAGNTFTLDTDCTMETYIGDIETSTKPQKIIITTNLWDSAEQKVVASDPPIIKNLTV